MTPWFLCILPVILAGAFVLVLSCCSAQRRLIRQIRRRRLTSLWWVHRHKAHEIELTSQTTARKPRQMHGEYNNATAILLSNFWLDGYFKKSDMFLVQNLYEKKPPSS
jgi:hypothetical protein